MADELSLFIQWRIANFGLRDLAQQRAISANGQYFKTGKIVTGASQGNQTAVRLCCQPVSVDRCFKVAGSVCARSQLAGRINSKQQRAMLNIQR